MSEQRSGIVGFLLQTHWHVISTHFPVSLFLTSTGFMVLHLFTLHDCFDLASFVTLGAGAVAMLPTTLSGWLTWHGRYKGARGKIFIYKSRIAYAMTGLSAILVFWRTFFPAPPHTVWHYAYAFTVALLLVGAFAEGHYGSRLTHR
jgi:uncharacterized membrane protein